MLDRIPAEILRSIVETIRTQSDLKSLCEVSKAVSEVATPCLYESITLHADDMLDLDALKDKIELCSNGNLKVIKNICLKAPLNYNLRRRCPHYNSDIPETLEDAIEMDPDSESDVTSLDPFLDLEMALNIWLRCLKRDTLQSLSLNLGCCIPNDILDSSASSFSENQKHIQSISLITDGGCPTSAHVDYLDLRPFTSLQSLSWKGLNRGDHFDCLESFIKNQTGARRLRALVLDLVEWGRADGGWYSHQRAPQGGLRPHPRNFFASNILGIQPKQETILFQSLETLLLSGVNFGPFENELAHSFNMMNLSTLQLRNCPASLDLLETLLNQGTTLRLKSFELVIDWDCLSYYEEFEPTQMEVVSRVLDSFQGLEHIFLLFTRPLDWYHIVKSIVNHRATLKRLILHERDVPNREVVDGGIPWCYLGSILFEDSKLNCFGTSGPISEMEYFFAEAPKPRCKILHFKMSWIDFHKKYEEELEDQAAEGSDFDDSVVLDFFAKRKLPLYPRAAPSEVHGSSQIHSPESSSSSNFFKLQGLTMQELQISTRTREIANRSDFDDPASPVQELLKFAHWAFGPDGLPELRILAWGDFSHDGRWKESNVLLCRDQSLEPTGANFRTLKNSDFHYWDLIDENMDMLSACSPDLLLRDQYGLPD